MGADGAPRAAHFSQEAWPDLVLDASALAEINRRARVLHESAQAQRLNGSALSEVEDDATAMHYDYPLVVNRANMPMVVYLERGFLFNKQVIMPGEAVQLWSKTWGPNILPYSIIALVGDKSAVPSTMDSVLSFVGMSAVPTAFVGGVIVSVVSWGALTGPAAALTGLVSNAPAIMGYTIASVDIAAGVVAAGGGKQVAEFLVKEHPKAFMAKRRHNFPGTKYFEITGGPDGSETVKNMQLTQISAGQYLSYNISTVKLCIGERTDHKMDESDQAIAFAIDGVGDSRAKGMWIKVGMHSHRPRYRNSEDESMIIEWSASRKAWRMFYDNWLWKANRATLYQSEVNLGVVPRSGWVAVEGGLPTPEIDFYWSTEEDDDSD